MADVPITFGPWEPDRAPHMSPALSEAINVLPVAGAYGPFPSHVPVSGVTLPANARGFFATPLADGSPAIYTATATAIYRITDGALTSVYDAGGISAAPWWFVSFQNRVIAGNPNQVPVGGAVGTGFTALGDTPPAAAVGAVVERYFLMLGNLTKDGIDGRKPNRVRWSGFQNPDAWGTDVATQADFEDMPDEGGPIMAITGKDIGTIFQRKAISRVQYVGPPQVFDFTLVEKERGAISTGCVCDVGELIFYIADDGFYAWNGTNSIPIGTAKVDRWFQSQLEPTRPDLIVSGYDPVTRCVVWAFPQVGQLAPSTMIAYSIADQRWTQIDMPVQQIGQSATLPRSLENMPAPDLFVGSFDDPAYAGQKPVLAAIDSLGRYGTFTGSPLASTLSTGDWQSAPGQRSFVNSVRPIIDAAGVAVSVGEREQSSKDAIAWATPSGLAVDGRCPQRVDARYIRYRQTTQAGEPWTRAVGLEVGVRASGRR